MTTTQVRDWLCEHEGFPASYELENLRLAKSEQDSSSAACHIHHILPKSVGGVDHPYNYYILPEQVNRLWSGWWSKHKRSYMGKVSYEKFQKFVLWARAEAACRRVNYNEYEVFLQKSEFTLQGSP